MLISAGEVVMGLGWKQVSGHAMACRWKRMARPLVASLCASVAIVSQAEVNSPQLDALEKAVRQDGTHMQDLSLETLAEVRADLTSGRAVPAWRLGSLISKLTREASIDVPTDGARALRKIDTALQLAADWREELEPWSPVQADVGTLLMMRWFLRGDDADRLRAQAVYEESDRRESNPKFQGSGASSLAATYEEFASNAKQMGLGRAREMALLRAGIAANKAGRARYPQFDSATGLGALYGKFAFITGGSAMPEVLDEWIADVGGMPAEIQARQGNSVADALFEQGRDEEAAAWLARYAQYWASAEVPPALETRFRAGRCQILSLGRGFSALQVRAPQTALRYKMRICAGQPLEP
jgi:hypothetical protein